MIGKHYIEHEQLIAASMFGVNMLANGLVKYERFNEFPSLPGNDFSTYASRTGATCALAYVGSGNRFGVVYCGKGTTSGGRACFYQGLTSFLPGYASFVMEGEFQVATIADATDDFRVTIGLSDGYALAPTDGVYFEYMRSESANWQCKCASNSTRTATVDADTSVPVTTDWVRLRIELNAAATQAKFYINGTLVKTITSNVPSGASRSCGASFGIGGIAGVNDRYLRADWVYQCVEYAGARV